MDSCTSLGGINIRMLGFVIQVRIYTFKCEVQESIIEVHLITTRTPDYLYIFMNLRLQLNSWPL
jgi:hypothetical protein